MPPTAANKHKSPNSAFKVAPPKNDDNLFESPLANKMTATKKTSCSTNRAFMFDDEGSESGGLDMMCELSDVGKGCGNRCQAVDERKKV